MTEDTPRQFATLQESGLSPSTDAGRRPTRLFRSFLKFAERIKWGTLIVELPNGDIRKFEGGVEAGETAVIAIKRYRVANRLLFGGGIGFYEAYADGDWDTPDLSQLLHLFARNADYLQDAIEASLPGRLIHRTLHAFNRNTKSGARRNIIAHYDLGNAFYEKWLDRTMTYSSAKFAHPGQDLATAQLNKYRELARRIDLKPGDSLLEIGSGWGGFAEFAAGEIGARVTGITISDEQFEYARARMQRAGLADRVDIRLQDYRDVDEQFDKVASIEMFEAVGAEYWPTYFRKLRDVLKPGGIAGLQIITIDDRYFSAYRRTADFIQRYVFPGGMLPSPSALRAEIAKAGLAMRDNAAFGRDYAATLKSWHERFLAAWDDIREMGFDEKFKKLWRYYLSYCEAGFRAGSIDVAQIAVARPD